MMSSPWITALGIAVAFLVVLPLISYAVEALRRPPDEPQRLSWDERIPIRHASIAGVTLRYITTGEGPPLVLLHTLRTQLDMFQKVIPELSKHFKVYALDYPGHGFSEIAKADYTPRFFATYVRGFLDELDIQGATLAGESIGGTLALMLAAERNPRVSRAIAINPYDYDRGRGALRSSWVAKVLFGLNNVPVLGATFWRLRSLASFRLIMAGGVYKKEHFPPQLMKQMSDVGNRPYHYRAFMSLVKNFALWEAERAEYGKIQIPVLLIYGDHDWSRPEEREETRRLISGAQMSIVKGEGHFLSLDAPEELIELIHDFCRAKSSLAQSV